MNENEKQEDEERQLLPAGIPAGYPRLRREADMIILRFNRTSMTGGATRKPRRASFPYREAPLRGRGASHEIVGDLNE